MIVLGLDPGREKVGWALVGQEGDLFWSGICLMPEMDLFLEIFYLGYSEESLKCKAVEKIRPLPSEQISFIVVGNGTGSYSIIDIVKRYGFRVIAVDERESTLEARTLYWNLHQAGWRRCLPRSLWIPPRPVDDLAAWVIARRGLVKLEEASNGFM